MPASVYYPDIAQPEDQEDVHLTLCGVTAIIKTQTDDDHVAVECQNIHRSKSGRQIACEINGEADERFMIIIKNRTRPSVPLECEVHMDGRRMDEFQVLPGRDGDFEARGVLVCHHGKTQVRPFLFSRVVYGDSSTSHASTSTARDREPRVQNGYYDLGTIILKLYRTRQSIESQTPASPSADTRASHDGADGNKGDKAVENNNDTGSDKPDDTDDDNAEIDGVDDNENHGDDDNANNDDNDDNLSVVSSVGAVPEDKATLHDLAIKLCDAEDADVSMEPCLDRTDPPHKPWLVSKYDYKSGALRRAERARTIGGPIRSSKRLRGINAETSDSVKDEHPTSHILSQASKRQKGPEEPDSDKEEVRRKLKERIKEEWNRKKAELDQLDRQLSQLDRPSHPPKEETVTIGDWNGCTIELD